MKILLLAPHPFYEERGTPIDVMLVLRSLSERSDCHVDVITYHQGRDVSLENVTIHRIRDLRIVGHIRPGFSFKKLICDLFMFFKAWRLQHRNRYDLIHAGEEAVFMAMLFKLLYGTPYAYDLDSSIAQQLVEGRPLLRPFAPLFNALERLAIRHGLINFPVCNALADLCEEAGSRKTVTLYDISQLATPNVGTSATLKQKLGITGTLLLYVGNLEPYQGIDLLLDSFAIAARRDANVHLAIMGGTKAHVRHYRRKAAALGIEARTHFLGPQPFNELDSHLSEADILVCPRIRGINTPMKVFAYLHSGKPTLVTDIPTHNQILTPDVAGMAAATPEAFAVGILRLASDPALCGRIARNAVAFAEQNHTYEAHRRRMNEAYDWVREIVRGARAPLPVS